jgi:hypothetical protein
MDAKRLLEKTLEVFPLFTMGQELKRTPTLTLIDNRIIINLWWKNRSWGVVITEEEESQLKDADDNQMVEYLLGVKAEVENHMKAS